MHTFALGLFFFLSGYDWNADLADLRRFTRIFRWDWKGIVLFDLHGFLLGSAPHLQGDAHLLFWLWFFLSG